MRDYAAFDRYIDEHMTGWTDELVELCAIPSEATNPEALRAAASWIAARFERLGATVDVVETDTIPPLVIADVGSGRTAIALQHYDVQPAVPLELWTTPPYEPAIRDGRLYARGATDNKGELMARIWGLEAYVATIGELPCRFRFLVQGEEEGGGDGFRTLLGLRPGVLDGDAALSEGGAIDARGRGVIAAGARGMVELDMRCATLAYDAHSSLANLLPSATIRLVRALATFWDDDGVPAVEGLDAGALAPTPAQFATIDAYPLEELEDLRKEFRVERFVAGRAGRDAIRAYTLRPTLNVQGLSSGYSGPGGKTITPAEASAKIDIRLVPGMEPSTVVDTVRRHLGRHGFGDIEIESFEDAYGAWWTSPDHPLVVAAGDASADVLGKPSVVEVISGGTEPMYDVCAQHDLPSASIGGGDDSARAHAPNESYSLANAALAAKITGRFLDRFAALGEVPKAGNR
jgi:acetylornithine deacetylase/succinyl-diaminopimelate desuccinylase-like protein